MQPFDSGVTPPAAGRPAVLNRPIIVIVAIIIVVLIVLIAIGRSGSSLLPSSKSSMEANQQAILKSLSAPADTNTPALTDKQKQAILKSLAASQTTTTKSGTKVAAPAPTVSDADRQKVLQSLSATVTNQ